MRCRGSPTWNAWLVAYVFTIAVACERDSSAPSRPATAQAITRTPVTSTGVASRAVQPLLIEHDTVALQAPPWTDASAMDALRAASLHPQLAAGAARHSDLSVPGISVRIDGGQVELFVYGDANTAGRAAASVATTPAGALRAAGDSIPSAASTRPVVLATDNLVAIVLSRSGQVQRRVHDALSRRQHTVSDASLH